MKCKLVLQETHQTKGKTTNPLITYQYQITSGQNVYYFEKQQNGNLSVHKINTSPLLLSSAKCQHAGGKTDKQLH